MVRTRKQSVFATPVSEPVKTARQPSATATTPKTPLTSSTTIIPSSLKSVFLYDWWLVKADGGDGKGLAVGGFASRERAGLRVFYSAAISKRHEATILKATDGIIITVSGFINRSRSHENGFPPKVYNHFLLGFPFNWKDYMSSTSDPFQCIQGSTSHSDHEGASRNLEPDSDDLAVTRLRDLFLSTYGESSHYLFMKSSNSSSSPIPMEIFESGLNETPKGPREKNSYQYLKEQGSRDEGENVVLKDPLHASQEAKSRRGMEFQIPRSGGVCTRSMTKLKHSKNRGEESILSDSQKRQNIQEENNASCQNSGKGTGQRVKSRSNVVTSPTKTSIIANKEADSIIADHSESRRLSLRLRNRKQNQKACLIHFEFEDYDETF